MKRTVYTEDDGAALRYEVTRAGRHVTLHLFDICGDNAHGCFTKEQALKLAAALTKYAKARVK